jgi:hypothetical protein
MNSSAAGLVDQVDRLLDAVSPAGQLDDDGLRARVVECEQATHMLQAIQADAEGARDSTSEGTSVLE